MKKVLLSIFVLISVSSFGQKVDSIRNAIQVQPIQLNALTKDTLYQVHVTVFGLVVGDSTSGCNTYVTYHDRKGKKLGETNIPIPASVVNKWGTDDAVIKEYVIKFLNLTKR